MPASESVVVIPVLAHPPTLFVDEGGESVEAERMLREAGIEPVVARGLGEPFYHIPLVLYDGGFFVRIDEIRGLIGLLRHWSIHLPTSSAFLQSSS